MACARAAGDETGAGLPVHVAAGDDKVDVPLAHPFDHRHQKAFVVLQVGVERCDVTRLARQHALEQGAGKTAAADAPDAANSAVGFADGAGNGRRSIGGVVVDKKDFPINSDQKALQPRDENRDVRPFVQGGDDDGNLRRRGDGWRNGVGLIQQTRICGECGSHGFFSLSTANRCRLLSRTRAVFNADIPIGGRARLEKV